MTGQSKFKFGLMYETEEGVREIEEWLDLHMQGDWSLNVEGISDDLRKKNFKVLFEHEHDKDLFKRHVTRRV